ncbi:MAG: LemA family protein [Deltaproteobacteria bacterium]|nr:LemA family protein [Deltaproteobacteria bacterium]
MGSWIIIGIIVLVALYLTLAYNSLVRMRNSVQNAWRQIDVQLRRRHDLIPNLVDSVKGYMQFERNTLTQVIEARNRAVDAPTQEVRLQAENQLTAGLGRLFALMENYPQLKADENVLQLQEQLTTTENQIAFARQAYNDAVLELNNRIETFPANIVANQFGFHPADYFQAPVEEQIVPKVDLSLGTPRAS